MSKMANKSVIGAFVIGAIALAVIAVVIFGSGKFLRRQQDYIMFFEGSVKGLSIGSPVIFRGVKIGEVKDISIRFRQDELAFFIPVLVEVDVEKVSSGTATRPTKPFEYYQALIDKGMKAQLQSQSFVTGQLAVALDFFPDKPIRLVGLDKKYHEIPTVPTTLEDLEKSLRDLDLKGMVASLKTTMTGIEKTVNSPEIQKTLNSVSEAADGAKMMMRTINSQVTPLASNANETVKEVQKLVQNLDRQVAVLVPSIEGTIEEAQKLVQNLDGQVTALVPGIEGTIKDAQKLVQNLDGQVGPLASNVDETVKDVRKLVQNLDTRIDPIALNAEETLEGINRLVNGDIKNLVVNLDRGVAQVLPEIVRSLETLRGTLVEAQAALGSFGGAAGSTSPLMYQLTKTLEDVSNTAHSFRSLADYIAQHPESLVRGK